LYVLPFFWNPSGLRKPVRLLMRYLMIYCIFLDDTEKTVRTTVTIDDELFQRALEVADPGTDKADLFREAMKVFVRVQAGKRLAALGGKTPRMKSIPRRRPL
jgi:Arc/MetJ family transcription regulator